MRLPLETLPKISSINRLSTPFNIDDINRLRQRIVERVPFYVRMQVSSFEARAACLLDAMVNETRPAASSFHAFFCSSTSEAISGALKIVRQNHFVRHPEQSPITAVYDPTNDLRDAFDPLGRGLQEALVPGLVYFDNWQSFQDYVTNHTPASVLLRHTESVPIETLDELLREAARKGIYTIFDESSTELSSSPPLTSRLQTIPDVITFGENLGGNKVPIGCVLMSKTVFKLWDNTTDYSLHSNTWGGNSASLASVLEYLPSTPAYATLPPAISATIHAATESHLTTTRLYQRHCNPTMAKMLNISGLNKDIRSAYRAQIETATRRGTQNVIDASGTYGVNLQGHNPEQVIEDVLSKHDVDHDYWRDLQLLIGKKTDFCHVFPAVSGAIATEVALTIALLAAAPKKKVIALKGGFGGKTLPSLIATSRDRFKAPFGPLYPHRHYIDPFDKQGQIDFLRYLETGDVAVVILETVQGEGGVKTIPASFLNFLQEQKEKHGFFIAVDEVQTGMYRTGDFLSHSHKLPATDLVLMAKALSGNIFPVAAVLVTASVYQQAKQIKASVVERCENEYRCQFGAHMAIHAIEVGEELGLADHARAAGADFLAQLKKTTSDLPFVKEVRGEGLMIGIEFDESKLPRLLRGSFGGLIASRCVNDPKQPVLVAFNPDKPFLIRFCPPLSITQEEIDVVIQTFDRALRSGFFELLRPIIANTVNAKLGRF